LRRHRRGHGGPGGRLHLPGPVRRAAPPRLDRTGLRRPGRRQPAARPARRRGLRRRRGPLSSHAMTSDTTSPPSTAFRVAGDLRLLTWPALDASGAGAVVTARSGGVSSGPYATLNLSLSVGDDPGDVLENRRRLAVAFGATPGDFVFSRQ